GRGGDDEVVEGGGRNQALGRGGPARYEEPPQLLASAPIQAPARLQRRVTVENAIGGDRADPFAAVAAVVDQWGPDQFWLCTLGIAAGAGAPSDDCGTATEVADRHRPEQRAVGGTAGDFEDAVAATGDDDGHTCQGQL